MTVYVETIWLFDKISVATSFGRLDPVVGELSNLIHCLFDAQGVQVVLLLVLYVRNRMPLGSMTGQWETDTLQLSSPARHERRLTASASTNEALMASLIELL